LVNDYISGTCRKNQRKIRTPNCPIPDPKLPDPGPQTARIRTPNCPNPDPKLPDPDPKLPDPGPQTARRSTGVSWLRRQEIRTPNCPAGPGGANRGRTVAFIRRFGPDPVHTAGSLGLFGLQAVQQFQEGRGSGPQTARGPGPRVVERGFSRAFEIQRRKSGVPTWVAVSGARLWR
jgi:hypothetical protein